MISILDTDSIPESELLEVDRYLLNRLREFTDKYD